jgi:hypothetical protein
MRQRIADLLREQERRILSLDDAVPVSGVFQNMPNPPRTIVGRCQRLMRKPGRGAVLLR